MVLSYDYNSVTIVTHFWEKPKLVYKFTESTVKCFLCSHKLLTFIPFFLQGSKKRLLNNLNIHFMVSNSVQVFKALCSDLKRISGSSIKKETRQMCNREN